MSNVVMYAAVSLDGYVANEQDEVGPLFDFYENGEVSYTFSDEERVFHVTPETASFFDSMIPRITSSVVGRHLFDITDGWGGRPPAGEHVFVVTHEAPTDWAYADGAPFTFVTDGIASAIAQAKARAGDGDVSVAAGDVGGQAFREGLVDQVVMTVVPVVLGSGKPYFGAGGPAEPALLDNPTVVSSDRATHLVYDVRH